ncbi:unnamed protein product [Urochloa humidicola]
MAIGDPNTRPEEETVYVPNSFDLERDARDWEECTLVPWAMHLPRGAGARDIEELLLDKLRLEPGDITVTINQPEPFLIRFKHAADCAAARSRGRFTDRGIDICLRPGRASPTRWACTSSSGSGCTWMASHNTRGRRRSSSASSAPSALSNASTPTWCSRKTRATSRNATPGARVTPTVATSVTRTAAPTVWGHEAARIAFRGRRVTTVMKTTTTTLT